MSRSPGQLMMFITSVVVVLSAASCTQMTQSEIRALETRELDMPYEKAYKAALNGLFSLGFTVDHSDKETGIVSGKRHDPRTGAKIAGTLLFGIIGLAATESKDEAVTFMVTPAGPDKTVLRMKVVVNGKSVVDRKLMTEIWQRIEKEAMLTEALEPNTAIQATQPKGKSDR